MTKSFFPIVAGTFAMCPAKYMPSNVIYFLYHRQTFSNGQIYFHKILDQIETLILSSEQMDGLFSVKKNLFIDIKGRKQYLKFLVLCCFFHCCDSFEVVQLYLYLSLYTSVSPILWLVHVTTKHSECCWTHKPGPAELF